MGFLPKRLTLQNLDQVSVFIEDTNNEYFNVQEVPETITQGRYAFKVFGSDFLREGIELKLELLDSEGNTIYLTPVDFIGEEVPPYVPYRYVTIEVYSPPINVAGLATLTILGEVNPNVVDVPIEFQNAYNVRYQTKINVDLSTVINTQPIRFFKNPTTEFQEIVQPKTALIPISQSIVRNTASGIPRSDLKDKIIQIESGSLEKESLPKEVSDTFKDLRRFKDEYKYKTGLRGRTPAIISRRGLSTVFASKEEPKFKIKSDSAVFTADMQGGTIEIPERTITLTKTDSQTGRLIEESVTVPKFETKILEVVDENTIVPEEPPLVVFPTGSQPTGTDIKEVTIQDFSNTPFTASFNVTDTSVSQSAIHSDSLLDLTIKDMRTFSGDIYRVRVHGKSEAAASDFTVLTDVIVESPELLIDKDSSSGVLRTGYFINQSHVNTYWNTFSINGTTLGTNVSATHTNTNFIDSINISGSNYGLDESVVVETKPLKSFTLRKNVAYTLTAKVKGQTTNKIIDGNNSKIKRGKLFFHLSGSNLNTSQLVNHTFFGSELTDDSTNEPVVLQLDEDIDGIQNFETIEHTFKPRFKLDRTVNTDTILQIRAESGEWFISDISLRPAMDTGFSPDEFNLKVPIPRSTRPDRFDFLVEYFDINNNVAETVTVVQDVPISGSALVIDGDGNLLTGSLFMGNAVDSGIEAAGVNSAFVRSVGYEGFESASLGGKGGFMIFSGSVLPNSPDNYEGAGLEIHDGTTGSNESFFKFRTNPSVLDIKTSTFFFGKESGPTNFISGSNGNLQISSSNFELSPEGNVTMSGEVSATGGTIGGFDIADTTISTTGVTLGNSTEDLFISSSQFKVDHEGNITASNIDLGGTISATSGDVGGFQINAGSLTAGAGQSAITMSSADKIIAIGSGSTFNKGDLAGGFRVGIDTDGEFKFAVGNAGSFIHADASGVSIKSDSFVVTASVAEIDVDVYKLSANNLFISSSDGGFISAGNPRPTGIDGTNKGIFFRGNSPAALIGDSNGSHIKFDGTTTSISSSAFGLGGPTNFISGSNGNIKIFNTGETTLSGSSVNIQTPKFFLGSLSQFVSGSNGNIEISSSNFHLDSDGNVIMSGKVTANEGTIGGFDITDDALSSANFFISGSATGNSRFISSTNFNVKASGDVTASALDLTGGAIGGIDISANSVSVGSVLQLKDSGQITGSNVLFTGGTIGGFELSSAQINDTDDNLILKSNGQITGSKALLSGGKIAAWNLSGNNISSTGGGIRLNGNGDNSEISVNSHTFGNEGIQLGFNGGAPRFYVGNGGDNFLRYDTSNGVNIQTLKATISGSEVSLLTPKFFFGNSSNFISGSNGNIEIFNTGTTTLSGSQVTIETPKFFMGGTQQFLSGSGGNLEISSSGFHLTPQGDVSASNILLGDKGLGDFLEFNSGVLTVQGEVFANSINTPSTAAVPSASITSDGFAKFVSASIGGFEVTETQINSTNNNIILQSNGSTTLSGSSIDIKTPKFFLGESSQFLSGSNGNIEISSSNFHLDNTGNVVISGNVTATTGEIGGFTIGDDLDSTSGTLKLKGASGQITASAAQITGKITAETGTIGGFNIGTDLTNSAGSTLNLKGSTGQITASAAQITGNVTATSGQIAGFTIDGNTLTATNFTLDASGKSITLGTGTDIFIADGDVGIHLGHGTFGSAPFSVTKAGVLKATSGTIGGWTLSSNTIVGSNLTLNSSGLIETNDFASGVRGFRLDSTDNGVAEFENISIRGTLKTTVFEKETVNAVGGQLYVANSTTLTGSLNISASAATMSVVNVTGFTGSYNNDGEILVAKKITDTGFSTEYILVQSASRDEPSSSTNFAGKLFVVRGYQSGSSGDFLGDNANQSHSLAPGQVLASTGRIGTGYIRLNANPTDTTTPYIDIVERTGSGVYDVDLKARLGDLSGLSTQRLQGTNPSDAGFGLYSQNVFLEGGIIANTGSIGGINMEAGKLYNGVGEHGNSNTGFYVDSGSQFSLGDKLVWDGSTLTVEGAINISGGGAVADQLAALNAETGSLQSSVSVLGEATASLQSSITTLGETTASLQTSITTLGQATASLQSATGSLQTNIDTVESNVSGAFTSTSASIVSTIDSVEANVSGAFTSTSASIASDITTTSSSLASTITSTSSSLASTITTTSSSLASTVTTVSSSTAERIMTDVSGSILEIAPSPSGQGLFLNYPHMGFYNNSEFTAFISASGGFLFKADDNNLISFGQSVSGGDGSSTKSFVLKSDNVFLSGSKVNILGERFFLGGQAQFISGSGGNLEISSSNFHLTKEGNITASNANLSGKITSNEGEIGGFEIGQTLISSSIGGLILNADGGLTGSKFLLQGGIITDDVTIEGDLSANSISTPTGGSPKSQITSQGFAKFVSASIGGFDVNSTQIKDKDGDLVLNSLGQITASNAKISGDITISSGPAKSVIDSLGEATASLQSSVTTLGEATASLESSLTTLGETTASLQSSITTLGETTASLQSSITTLGQATASLQSATGSLQTNIDNVESNVSGAFTSTSASLASTIDSVEANVSGAFTSVSESITERIMTDSTGLVLDIPDSPSGEGLFLNYPYLGFYGKPTITDTTYVVTESGGVYYIDGVQQATVELQVGYTYRFDTSAVGSHPFRFSTDSGNSSQYTTGVTVGSGYVDIEVTSSTPSTLYYYCTIHGGMGGQINVVDNSEFKAFISASGGFLFKADDNNLISFGQSVSGGDGSSTKSFVLKSDNVFLSGSKVNILGERFFLGGGSQFISGSGGNIEISSSKFHVQPDGDVVMNNITASNALISGDITITGGSAKNVLDSLGEATASLQSSVTTLGTVTASLNSATASLQTNIDNVEANVSGAFTSTSESIASDLNTVESNVSGAFTSVSESITERIMTDSKGLVLDIPASPSGEGLFLNYPYMGFYDNSEFTAFISASGGFLFKADDNNLISFGQSVSGGDGSSTTAFVLKSDNVFLSGSKVNILGERFFLGGQAQFISGSGGNLEISSSAFHLDPANNTMTLSGSITATDGTIGGMNIATNTIESTADAGDGSTTTYVVTANGNSNYVILGQSNPTLTLIPGNTYRFDVSDDTNGGHPFRFTESDGGTDYYTTGVTINGTQGDPGAYVEIVITQNTPNTLYYRCTVHSSMRGTLNIDKTSPLILDGNTGQITGSRVLFEGGKIGGAILTSGSISSGTSGYENDGFYLDSGGKFSLGNKLSWNGSSLSLEGAINITSGVTANQLADLNSETGSLQSSVTTLGEATASLQSSITTLGETTASLQSSITTLGQATASLQSATGSLQTNINTVEANVSGAFTSTSASIASDLNTVEANVSGAFTSTSASLASTIGTVSSSTAERIMTDISGSILSTPPAPSGEGLFLNFPHMGYYSGSAYQAFISASGGFLFKADDNNLISFGETVSGGDGVDTKSFVLKSDNVFLSGSKVNILGERFFLGGSGQFVSGSNGNIEISSSKFHVQPDGDVVMNQITASDALINGNITATTINATGSGIIGGFSIDQTTISSSNDNLILRSSGQITASSALINGNITAETINATGSGIIGGFTIDQRSLQATNFFLDSPTATLSLGTGTNAFANANRIFLDGDNNKFSVGEELQFDSNGLRISGSAVTFNTPKFFLGSDSQFVSGSNGNIEISSSKFHVKPDGDIVVRKVDATEGTIGNFHIASDSIRSGDADITDDGNQFLFIKSNDHDSVIAMANGGAAIMTRTSGDGGSNVGGIFLKGDGTFRLGKSNGQRIENDGNNLIMSSSKFFLGGGSQFVSGSNGNIEISSSAFHLTKEGNITASNANLSGKITATSGEIGGFLISENEISSSATPKRGLVLKPGDAISGFGNSAHSTRTVEGMFSFGVASVSPPVGSDGNRLLRSFNADNLTLLQAEEPATP